MMSFGEVEEIDPRILNLSNRRRWMVSFTPRSLLPRERGLAPVS